MLRRLGGAALLGALAYTAADAAADAALYLKARGLVLDRAAAHERLCAELGGPPLAAGPWYNSSVAVSHDGHIATVTLPLRGTKRSSDVTVRVVRQGGLRSTLLYNVLGGGEWQVLVMSALVGMGAGGVPISMSLLQPPEQPDAVAAAAHTAAAMGHGGWAAAAEQQRRREAAEVAAAAGARQRHGKQKVQEQ